MRGSPWEPVPGVKGEHVPVEIKEDGNSTIIEEETVEAIEQITIEEEAQTLNKAHTTNRKSSGIVEFHIRKIMMQKY